MPVETRTTAVTVAAASPGSGSKRRRFARHFGEMLLAMVLGMLVLGGLAEAVFAIVGSSTLDQSGALQVTLMGFNMAVPMVLWMSYRGHPRARTTEMAAAMVAPTGVAAILAVTSVLGESAALTLQHVVMIPAMLGVMLWRYEHYSQPHGKARA